MRALFVLWLVVGSGCDLVFLTPRDGPIDGPPPDMAPDTNGQARISILASDDDGLENPDGSMLVAYAYLSIYTPNHWGALRFTLPQAIVKGTTITVAHLEAVIDSTMEDAPALELTTEASATPSPLLSTSANISQRVKGSERVVWMGTELGEGLLQSPSLVSLITERTAAPDWTPGASVLLILDGQQDSLFELRQFDHVDTIAPTLVLEWTN